MGPDCGHQGKSERYIQTVEDLAHKQEIPTEGVACSNHGCPGTGPMHGPAATVNLAEPTSPPKSPGEIDSRATTGRRSYHHGRSRTS